MNRRATHAGSWYTSQGTFTAYSKYESIDFTIYEHAVSNEAASLNDELNQWLANAQPTDDTGFTFPVKGSKAVIAPFVILYLTCRKISVF